MEVTTCYLLLQDLPYSQYHTHYTDQERTLANLEPRAATLARVDLGEGRWVGVCVTHLDHMSEELRQRQAREVAAAAADCFGGEEGCPSFLCGDLNTFDRADMSNAAWEAACAFYASRGWPAPTPRSLVCEALEGAGYTDAFRDWQSQSQSQSQSQRPDSDEVRVRPELTSSEPDSSPELGRGLEAGWDELRRQHGRGGPDLKPANRDPPPLTCWSHQPLYRLAACSKCPVAYS